jgi:hypothetical protein
VGYSENVLHQQALVHKLCASVAFNLRRVFGADLFTSCLALKGTVAAANMASGVPLFSGGLFFVPLVLVTFCVLNPPGTIADAARPIAALDINNFKIAKC